MITKIARLHNHWIRKFSTSAVRNEAWIKIAPQVCLHDVPTCISAGGFKINAPVTLRGSLIDGNGKLFTSHAHYVTDHEGNLNVSRDKSVGGSYTGIFPSGILTTLKPGPKEFPYLRLYSRDPTTPWKIKISIHEGHECVSDETPSIVEDNMERHLTSPGVKRIPIDSGRVRGALYVPSGPGPHPGIIDMFGTAGGLMEFRAAMLASRGIASLALAFFAYKDLPKTVDNLELEYFEEAVEVLLSHPDIIPDRCGVVSISKASEIALTMSLYLEKVKAVLSVGGSPITTNTSLSYKGSKLTNPCKLDVSHMTKDKEGRVYPLFEKAKKEIFDSKEKVIPIYDSKPDTYYLFVAGDQDAWHMYLSLDLVKEAVKGTKIENNINYVLYKGAGHIIEPPYSSLIYQSYMRHMAVHNKSGTVIGGSPILWGGEAYDTCIAQEDLWSKTINFFNHNVRDLSPCYQTELQKKHDFS